MGAWIETGKREAEKHSTGSHPMWVRGLKPSLIFEYVNELQVAPYVGAWIETDRIYLTGTSICRTLCGCVDWNKLCCIIVYSTASRTLCGCVDWNSGAAISIWAAHVAPYVGAWIETDTIYNIERRFRSHPMWVRGLKRWARVAAAPLACRTLCGCVDWNTIAEAWNKEDGCRTLCGCVDWNAVSLAMEANILRAYLHGIEMQQRLLLWCKMRYLYQKIVL